MLEFDFLGAHVRVVANGDNAQMALSFLRFDFEGFLCSQNQTSTIQVFLESASPPELPKGRNSFQWKGVKVFGSSSTRTCLYPNGQTAHSIKGGCRNFRVFGKDPQSIRELAFVGILSMVGEFLDKKGFHRVHAAGFSDGKAGTLIIGPSGMGKSTLFSQLLESTNLQFFSDESPVLQGGRIHPFPLRLARRLENETFDETKPEYFKRQGFPQKKLQPFPRERMGRPVPCKRVIFLKKSKENSRLHRVGFLSVLLPLLKYFLVGYGLTQMGEHLLRTDNLFGLFKISLSRLNEAIRNLRHAQFFILFAKDPTSAIQLINN